MMNKNQAVQWLDSMAEPLFHLSDQIWDHPELGFEEHMSAQLLAQLLETQGFQVTWNLAGIPTAFCGRFGSGKPCIGLLGEYDALPGLSQQAGAVRPIPTEDSMPSWTFWITSCDGKNAVTFLPANDRDGKSAVTR